MLGNKLDVSRLTPRNEYIFKRILGRNKNINLMQNFIRNFVGLDKNLDDFIQTICIEDNSEFTVLSNFMTSVNRNMTNMLKYIV